jgi:hypothetical protein
MGVNPRAIITKADLTPMGYATSLSSALVSSTPKALLQVSSLVTVSSYFPEEPFSKYSVFPIANLPSKSLMLRLPLSCRRSLPGILEP